MSTPMYPPARPQLVSEVLDSAFRIFSASLMKALPYGMLITLAGQLPNIYNLATGRITRRALPQDRIGWVIYVVSLILTVALWAALILRQGAIAQGAPVAKREELLTAVRRLPALAALSVLEVLIWGVGIVLFVIPGVYLLIALWLAVPLLVLEGKGPIEAMKSSFALVRGHWWRTLGIVLVMLVIYFVFILFGIVFAGIVVQFERGADVAVVTATSTVFIITLGAFGTPFIVAMMLAVLGDLRARAAAAVAVANRS